MVLCLKPASWFPLIRQSLFSMEEVDKEISEMKLFVSGGPNIVPFC